MLALRLYKSYRWALAAIAQHGAENVAVLVQGQMSKADEIESAGISAVLKKPKEEELILKPVVFVASEPALAASFVKPPFDEEKPRFFLDFCAQIREIWGFDEGQSLLRRGDAGLRAPHVEPGTAALPRHRRLSGHPRRGTVKLVAGGLAESYLGSE